MSDAPHGTEPEHHGRAIGLHSLTVTLAVAFLTLSVSVLVISTALQTYFEFRTQQEVVHAQQHHIATDTAAEVYSFVEGKIEALENAVSIGNIVSADAEARETLLGKILGSDESFRTLTLLSKEGETLETVSRFSGTVGVPDRQFREILSAIDQDGVYISSVNFDATTNEPLIWIAVAAHDVFGDTQAIVLVDVNLKFMWDIVADIERTTGWTTYVVDKEGNLIAYIDTARVLRGENLAWQREVGKFIGETGIHSDEVNEETATTKGIEHQSVLSTFAPVGTPDWGVIIELPVFVAYAAVLQVIWYSIAVLILSIILAVLSGIYLSRRITKPLRDLSLAAEEFAEGKLQTRIPVKSENEIGFLAGAFNAMAEKLQGTYAGMDEKIREKTDQLSHQVEEVQKSKSAILNLLEDIDDEKNKAEGMVVERTKELTAEKARLLASINSLSFGFVLADTNDRIILKNPRLKAILEYEKEPMTIHDIAQNLKAADSKIDIDIASSCKKCMDLKEPVEFKEVPYGKKFLRIICAPISAEKETIGYLFLVEDITEAKVMERSRDEFFAVASHELRTPLTAIRGNADMILQMFADKIPDKDVREMLEDINSSSIRLIDVVNDFLEVSRLEQGKVDFKLETFDIYEVVTKVMRDLKDMISKKALGLRFTPPLGPLPKVFADRNRTEQVLVNLIGNAAKFTREGSITIEILLTEHFIKVAITDTGVGISEHNQALLFRKFQQAGEDMLARDVTQSTGLGLYISHMLIEGMGGEIKLEKSELGKGSVFSFTLPLAPATIAS